MKNITEKGLKQGQQILFSNNGDDTRTAEISWSDTINKFCIWFNGKLFSFKSFNGMKGKLSNLSKKWNLKYINTHY